MLEVLVIIAVILAIIIAGGPHSCRDQAGYVAGAARDQHQGAAGTDLFADIGLNQWRAGRLTSRRIPR